MKTGALKKSKFTLLDMSVIVIIAILLISLLLRNTIIGAFRKTEYVNVTYTYQIPRIEKDKAEAIDAGCEFMLIDGDVSLGKVTGINSLSPAYTEVKLPDGTQSSEIDPRYSLVVGTAEATLAVREDGYYTESGELFAKGSTFEVTDGKSVFTIKISRFELLE